MNYIAVSVLGLTRIEFYRMNPGIFYDMWHIHVDIHSNKDDKE